MSESTCAGVRNETELSAAIFGKLIALGFVAVKRFCPTVVPPRLPRAALALPRSDRLFAIRRSIPAASFPLKVDQSVEVRNPLWVASDAWPFV
jgi:hypothetical protein